ncbi:MAG: SOS response-associated peptidase [Gemmatales bacterium]
MCYHFFHLPIAGPRIVTMRLASLLEFPARYHVVPTQEVAVIRAVQQSSERELTSMRWGLIPSWVRDPAEVTAMMANARAETLAAKASFKQAYQKRRCLILADGFFEWKRHLSSKQPYCIRPSDRDLVTFAGIWERWEKKEQVIESCSIVTTAAKGQIAELHDRMPVMLPSKLHDQWLDPAETKTSRLDALLNPVNMLLDVYPVKPLKGRNANSDPTTIEPIEAPLVQRGLFDS